MQIIFRLYLLDLLTSSRLTIGDCTIYTYYTYHMCCTCYTHHTYNAYHRWMPIVFRRFETTVALPVEYGAVNAGSVLSGLLFYQEHSSLFSP